MRLNVYTEELITSWTIDQPKVVEIVKANYISSRTGEQMTNYGLRIFVKSAPELHYIEGRDDDRSAITFWCGSKEKNIAAFIELIRACADMETLETWRDRVERDAADAEEAERERYTPHHNPTPEEVKDAEEDK